MSKFFRTVIGAKEPLFSATLKVFEKRSGNESRDIAYQADIMTRARELMRTFGLDPHDTTKAELYMALNAHVDDLAQFAETKDVVYMYSDGDVISCNHQDVQTNVKRSYGDRTTARARRAIIEGLLDRYESQTNTRENMTEALRHAGVEITQKGIKS